MKIACGWLYALNKYGYPPTFDGVLAGIDKAREWGFDAFEMEAVGEGNLREMYEGRHELRRRIRDGGLALVNFVPVLPEMVSLDRAVRERALGLYELGAGLAAELGAQMTMCDSFEVPLSYVGDAPGASPIHYGQSYRVQVTPEFDWERVWDNLVEVMRRSTGIARAHGLRLGLEMRAGEAVPNTDAFLRLWHAAGSDPNFGVVFDTAHLHAQKEILPLSVEKLRDRIFLVHASDNDGTANRHLPPGQGTIDWQAVYRALRKHRFDGYTCLDIGDCPDLEAAYLESKRFFEALAI